MTIPNSQLLADIWLNALQVNSYRLTPACRAVVKTIANSTRALTPTEIYDLARKQYAALGLVTVYRTLAKLEVLELIQRVHQPADCHAYIANSPGHQHLLVCQQCGHIDYFSGDALDGLIDKVANELGYLIHDHWLQLFGKCAECQSISAFQG